MTKVIAKAPVNIALIKYWGKADEVKVLPTTHSLSLTLTDLSTETTFEKGPFRFYLNNEPGSPQETQRVKEMLRHFRDDHVIIRSHNNFPTASGLASSASGLAALSVGLNEFFQAHYTFSELVTLTRIGSGSACRSLVDDFAVWDKQGQVKSITNPFDDLSMIVMLVSEEKKAISSRDAMKITKETAPSYHQWIMDSEQDYQDMLVAIATKDFIRLGEVMERNSQRLHDVMANSQPAIIYQQPISQLLINKVKQARMQGLIGFTTMDAGPNVKILIQARELARWKTYLDQQTTVKYLVSRIGGKAYAESK